MLGDRALRRGLVHKGYGGNSTCLVAECSYQTAKALEQLLKELVEDGTKEARNGALGLVNKETCCGPVSPSPCSFPVLFLSYCQLRVCPLTEDYGPCHTLCCRYLNIPVRGKEC